MSPAAQVGFESLPVEVITAPSLRLDTAADRQRLWHTVQNLKPILLILDPLIRLHRVDENDATQIAALLSYLRELQRQFHVAVLLVHHARKDSHSSRPGQALAQLPDPVSVQQLRKHCAMRTAAVCVALEQLSRHGEVSRGSKGYQLNPPFPVSRSIDPKGNGNGKP